MHDTASASRAFRQRSRLSAIVFAVALLMVAAYGLTNGHVAYGLMSLLASGLVVKIGVFKRRARPVAFRAVASPPAP